MSNAKRDTQFLGFAGKVAEEIMVDDDLNSLFFDWDLEEQSRLATILARRAYDLVEHVIEHAPDSVSDADDWNIPDMLDLPEEKL